MNDAAAKRIHAIRTQFLNYLEGTFPLTEYITEEDVAFLLDLAETQTYTERILSESARTPSKPSKGPYPIPGQLSIHDAIQTPSSGPDDDS